MKKEVRLKNECESKEVNNFKKSTIPHGTKEWSSVSVNCYSGCSHGCLYCYAKRMAIRFNRSTEETWANCQPREHDVLRRHRLYKGTVMFPTAHDITPNNYRLCGKVLVNLLEAGNQVLIVSKPHLQVIQAICKDFEQYRAQMEFRFTIGAMDNEILSIWEPFAPAYEERKSALAHAFNAGFQTSVSIEPMLDPVYIDELVSDLQPFVTGTIWIGKLNYLGNIGKNNPKVAEAVAILRAAQSDDNILAIYDRLKDLPQIRWKDSIKKVILRHLPLDLAA